VLTLLDQRRCTNAQPTTAPSRANGRWRLAPDNGTWNPVFLYLQVPQAALPHALTAVREPPWRRALADASRATAPSSWHKPHLANDRARPLVYMEGLQSGLPGAPLNHKKKTAWRAPLGNGTSQPTARNSTIPATSRPGEGYFAPARLEAARAVSEHFPPDRARL